MGISKILKASISDISTILNVALPDEYTKLLIHADSADGLQTPYAHYKCNDDAGNTTVTDDGWGDTNAYANVNTLVISDFGKINQSFIFNGSSEYLICNDLMSDISSDTSGSFSCWIKPGNASGSIVGITIASANTGMLFDYNHTNEYIKINTRLGGADKWQRKTANGSVPVGVWTHITASFDGNDCLFYINGVLDNTAYTITTDKTFWFSDMGALDRGRIASNNYAGLGNVNFLNATLDDFRYYKNTALTADQAVWLYNSNVGTEGSGIDDATGVHIVKSFNDAQIDTAQQELGIGSVLFNGINSYLTIADSPDWDFGTDDFTIDFWVRFNVLQDSTFIDRDAPYQLYYWHGSTKLQGMGVDENWNPSTDTWYHIAVTRNGTDLRLFVDGTQLGGTITDSTNWTQASELVIGCQDKSTWFVNGWMDEIRISKGKARWISNFTPPISIYSPYNISKFLGVAI